MKTYAIWKNHAVIGYIDLTEQQADTLNRTQNDMYFGFDKVTNPEKYKEWPTMQKLTFDVNNGNKLELTQHQHDGKVFVNKITQIPAGDMVMLINYYK